MKIFSIIISLCTLSLILGDDCNELDPFDYGMCDMWLGWGWNGEECEGISGCSTINSNGIDDADWFFISYEICMDECSLHDSNHGDMNEDDNIDILDIVILVNIILEIIDPNDHQVWAGDLNFDETIDILDIILTIELILGGDFAGMSSWEIIQQEILDQSCISCHVTGNFYADQSGLILTADIAYEEMLNITPVNSSAAEDGLVILSDSGGLLALQTSYLWEKVDVWNQEHFYSDHPNYGSTMPMGGPFLTQGELNFIEQWIFEGAPDTGSVADVVLLNDDTMWAPTEFIPLDPPENGMQIHLNPFEVWENNEREIFYYTPLDTIDDLYIQRIEISMKPGSHHFILYNFEEGIPPPWIPNAYEIRDIHDEDGNYIDETFYPMLYHRFVAGTQIPYTNYAMPEGVALRHSSNFGFDVNSHFLNPSDSIYYGEVYTNLHLVDPSEVEHIAEIFDLTNTEIVLPPNEETTLEMTFMFSGDFSGINPIPPGTDSIFVFQLFSHAHELMTRFDVEFIGGELDGELIYTALDWEHPPMFELDPPLVITTGQGLKLEVTYNNWREDEVNFGFFSTDEMMILFGHYYTD